MSLLTTRQSIVAAITGIDGLHPSLERPSTIVVGSIWPVWIESRYTTRCVTEDDWDLVWTPGPSTTSVDLDAVLPLLAEISDALHAAVVGGVVSTSPGRLPPEDGNYPALRIRIVTGTYHEIEGSTP